MNTHTHICISVLCGIPGEKNGNSFQYSCLENPMDRGALQASPWGQEELDTTERLSHHYVEYTWTLRQIHEKKADNITEKWAQTRASQKELFQWPKNKERCSTSLIRRQVRLELEIASPWVNLVDSDTATAKLRDLRPPWLPLTLTTTAKTFWTDRTARGWGWSPWILIPGCWEYELRWQRGTSVGSIYQSGTITHPTASNLLRHVPKRNMDVGSPKHMMRIFQPASLAAPPPEKPQTLIHSQTLVFAALNHIDDSQT